MIFLEIHLSILKNLVPFNLPVKDLLEIYSLLLDLQWNGQLPHKKGAIGPGKGEKEALKIILQENCISYFHLL